MDSLRVCAVQMRHGPDLAGNLDHARALVREAAAKGARLALLPEYFFATFTGPPTEIDPAAVHAALRDASLESGIAVGGNVVERRGERAANVGVVYEEGRLVLEQQKVHPMPREAASGVEGGTHLRAGPLLGLRAGLLVCADILYPEASRVLSLQGADVLLNPVMSPWREEDDGKEARVAMYVGRAYDAGAFVVKAAGFRREATPPVVAGRSLVTAPWGVLARAEDDFEEALLVVDLDLARLRAFREKQAQFPARRPEAYGDLVR